MLAQAPYNLPYHPQEDLRFVSIEIEAQDHPPGFLLTSGFVSRLDISTSLESLEETTRDFFINCSRRTFRQRYLVGGSSILRQLVKADGDCLAKIHRDLLFACGDVEQPMTMAEIFVR